MIPPFFVIPQNPIRQTEGQEGAPVPMLMI